MESNLINLIDVKIRQSVIGISLLTKLVEKSGHNAKTMLKKSGIDAQLLTDPKASVSFQQEIAFIHELIKTMKDVDIGFKAGQCYRLNAFGHIGLAASSSDTVNEAIVFFLKYICLVNTPFAINFFKKDGNAILRFSDQFCLGTLKQFYLERDFSFAFLSTRDMFPRSIVGQKPKTIHFDFPCPNTVEHYENLYECSVHFSMPFNQILFDERYLDLQLPLANPLTRDLLEEQCKIQEVTILGHEQLITKIRHLIQKTQNHIPKLETIASLHYLTPRTLRRKLKAQGVTFQQLINEELCKKAHQYLLTTQMSIEQISMCLGYSESASFIHAFKRWTGKRPKEYRQSCREY